MDNKIIMMTDKDFEKALLEKLRNNFPEECYEIILNDIIVGKHSKQKRQIDVSVYHISNSKIPIIIADAKKYITRSLDIKHIEMFIGMLGDLDCKQGLIAPLQLQKDKHPYSKGALNRAKADNLIIQPILYDEAENLLSIHWKEAVSKIRPFDWYYDDKLSLALKYLSNNKIKEVIEVLDNVEFEEWQNFVEYGLKNDLNNTIRFLKLVMTEHYDSGWRFNAVANLHHSNLLSKKEVRSIVTNEPEIEFRDLLQT